MTGLGSPLRGAAVLALAALASAIWVGAPLALAGDLADPERAFGLIDQIGDPADGRGDAAALEQIFESAGLSGLDAEARRRTDTRNRAVVLQKGAGNRMLARQVGPGNLVLGVQAGNDNRAGAIQTGSRNTALVGQFGDGNRLPPIRQYGQGSFAAWAQLGDGLRGPAILQTTGSPPVAVIQRSGP